MLPLVSVEMWGAVASGTGGSGSSSGGPRDLVSLLPSSLLCGPVYIRWVLTADCCAKQALAEFLGVIPSSRDLPDRHCEVWGYTAGCW